MPHDFELGCLNAHEDTVWHETHEPDRWPPGFLWHEVQVAEEPGCLKAHVEPTPWQRVHDEVLCFAGRVWHAVQEAPRPGCLNAHDERDAWQLVHDPAR